MSDLAYVSSASLAAEIDFLMVRLSSFGILLVRRDRFFLWTTIRGNYEAFGS